jgi:alkylation response protein AidB-like acyl-CoA dehydrogenase
LVSYGFLFTKKTIRICLLGMALTEKQGGSDVRTNTTKAYCDNAEEKRYILIGHK